jgi:hypothetical protein
MALRQSKQIALILFVLLVFCHQAKGDTLRLQHVYSDSDQNLQNQKQLGQGLNKATWESLSRHLDFNEDTTVQKVDSVAQTGKQTKVSTVSGRLKYIWYILTVVLIVVVLVILWPYFKRKHIALPYDMSINEQEIDEETLRQISLALPLEAALKEGNYKLAFRIKYLEVLQQLVSKNLIDYRKERTNTDYLYQLKGSLLYDSFRQVTLSFDEVWYGEQLLDKVTYETLSEVFDRVKQAINKA